MRIKCRGIEFRLRWNFCNFFACSSFRVDKVSVAFAILNILLGIATLLGSILRFDFDENPFTLVSFTVGIGSVILNIVASAFVIYGYFKRNPGFYLPYMMNNAIVSICLCLFIVVWFIALFRFKMRESHDIKSIILLTTTLTYQIIKALISDNPSGNLFSISLIMMLLLFVFLTYPIYWSAYKLLNYDLQHRLNSINNTMSDSTRQQGQLMPPTTLDIAPVEFASPAELPCPVPIVQFAGTNTAAERASLHDSMADYKVI